MMNAELIKTLGLLPFFCMMFSSSEKISKIACVVLINGILCHCTCMKPFILCDILSNIFFICYINCNTSWQPYTGILTCISIGAFMGTLQNKMSVIWSIVHVFLVQWILAVCLLKFRHKSF